MCSSSYSSLEGFLSKADSGMGRAADDACQVACGPGDGAMAPHSEGDGSVRVRSGFIEVRTKEAPA